MKVKDNKNMQGSFETAMHIIEVQKNISLIIHKLLERASNHDASKLQPPEVEIFEEFTKDLKDLKYGTKEYNENLDKIKPALDHHYAKNRHHPQHFKNGIEDMNLIDILEMFCDWKASTKRTNDGNLRKSIEYNSQRFNINPQLIKIFENTIEIFD